MSLGSGARLVEFGAIPPSAWASGALVAHVPMQTYEWLSAAADILGQGCRTATLIVGEEEQPRALALLGLAAAGGRRLLGTTEIGESVEVLWSDEASLDELIRGLTRTGVAIDLGHYPNGLAFAERLRRAQGWRGVTLTRALSQRAAPSLPLDDTWKDPLQHFSSNRRQQLRRKLRNAEKIGPVAVEILTPTGSELEVQFDRAVAIEAKSWKGKAGTALLYDEKQAAFFRDYGRRMAATGQLRLCFLTIGGADAAMEYAVVWNNRFWSIKVGYNEEFSAVSPGEVLRLELVRRSAEQGLGAFEFCGKEAAWTRGWTDRAVEIAALRIYPFTFRGLGTLAHDSWEIGRRRLHARRSVQSE